MVTRGRFQVCSIIWKIENRERGGGKTPFTHYEDRKIKETLRYRINILDVFYVFFPLNLTLFVLLPVLRHPLCKHCSVGLTKIWTRL